MILFYFLIFVMPLERHHFWGAIAGDLTGIKYVGLICLPYAFFHLLQRGTVPSFLSTWQVRLFLALHFIASCSFIVFGKTPWNFSHWLSYTSFLIFFFTTLAVVDSLSRLRWVVLSSIG